MLSRVAQTLQPCPLLRGGRRPIRCAKRELPPHTLAHHHSCRPALSDHSSPDGNLHTCRDGISDTGSAVLFTVSGPRADAAQQAIVRERTARARRGILQTDASMELPRAAAVRSADLRTLARERRPLGSAKNFNKFEPTWTLVTSKRRSLCQCRREP